MRYAVYEKAPPVSSGGAFFGLTSVHCGANHAPQFSVPA